MNSAKNGVTIDSETGHTKSNWNAFKLWGIYKNYIYVRRIDDGMILINKNDLSNSAADELEALLNTNVKGD